MNFYREICRKTQNIHFVFSKTFLKLVYMIRKCVKFCTDRQARVCNVTGCIVIPYWISESTETHSENVQFHPFFTQEYLFSRVSVLFYTYITCLFLFLSLFCARWIRVHSVMSFEQVLNICNYVVC